MGIVEGIKRRLDPIGTIVTEAGTHPLNPQKNSGQDLATKNKKGQTDLLRQRHFAPQGEALNPSQPTTTRGYQVGID